MMIKIKGNEFGQEINDKDDTVKVDKIQDSNFEYEADEQLEVHIVETGILKTKEEVRFPFSLAWTIPYNICLYCHFMPLISGYR